MHKKIRYLLVLFAVLPLLLGESAAGTPPPGATCNGNGAGAPGTPKGKCAAPGPATLKAPNAVKVGAGNPMSILSGNKYQQESDMPALPGVLGLEVVRHYNSRFSKPSSGYGVMGRGWKLSYENELHNTGLNVQIVQADGARLIFDIDPANPSLCSSTDPANGAVYLSKGDGGTVYTWRWTDGRTVQFNAKGKITQIIALTGETVTMAYTAGGVLSSVTDPQGRTLRLNYPEGKPGGTPAAFGGVHSIDSPVGRFSYDYGSSLPPGSKELPGNLAANLVKVSMPAAGSGAVARHYHYEDPRQPTLLSGISVSGPGQAAQRIGTYLYNADGEGILTVKGEPARLQHGPDGKPLLPPRLVPGTGIEQVYLDRSVAGQTTISNSLGQKTVYRFGQVGGLSLLREVRGAGCASCGETNVRYAYDDAGRLTDTTRLSARGEPIQTLRVERDALGRATRSGWINYKSGKAGAPDWQLRLGYSGNAALSNLIVRPSVISGKEMRTEYVWNDKAQLLKRTDSGWTPGLAGAAALPLSRSTSYEYRLINGRSMMTRIDGPLANGKTNSPADSDVTVLEYDEQGHYLRRIIAPGNMVTRTLEFDAAGRRVLTETSDGIHPAQSSRALYNSAGKLLRMEQKMNRPVVAVGASGWWRSMSAWFSSEPDGQGASALVTTIDYDSHGRARRMTKPDGTYTEVMYDLAGRVSRIQDQDGSAVTSLHNTENQLLASAQINTAANAPMEVTTTYQIDALNRIAEVRSAHGAVTRYGYDAATGEMTSSVDAINRRTEFAYDSEGQLASVALSMGGPDGSRTGPFPMMSQQKNTPDDVFKSGNGSATRQRYDDFGRVVSIISPDSGTQLMQYDAADRTTMAIDGNGNRTSYVYDAANHTIERNTADKSSDGKPAPQRHTFRYQGALLVESANVHQSTNLIYDSNNRVVEQIDVIASAAAAPRAAGVSAPLRFVRRYSYDSLGRPHTRTLASGEAIVYSYNRSGQPSKIELRSADGNSVRTIVSDIDAKWVGGLVGFTHGNGLGTHYKKDRQTGLLTELTVAPIQARRTAAIAPNRLFDLIPSAHAANPAGELYTQRFKHDLTGRITAIARSGRNQSMQVAERYTYDLFDRLSALDNPSYKASWRYDGNGNRVEHVLAPRAAGQQVQTLQYQAGSNRLLAVTDGNAGTRAYQYDAGGNPVRIGQRDFVYGAGGRLQQVQQAGVKARYAFNALGERIAKRVEAPGKSGTKYFLYHARQLDAELDAGGTVVAQYIYFGTTPIAKLEYATRPEAKSVNGGSTLDNVKRWLGAADERAESRIYAIHSDHLGTPQLVTDSAQNVVWQARYSAYGRADVSVEAITLNLRFPGQYFDSETDTHYNYFRDYDPQTGRYVQSDPIGLAGGINTYAYVDGNPLMGTDFLGLDCTSTGGTFSCKVNNGGPSFGPLPAPPGWPSTITVPQDNHHHYAKETPAGRCTRADLWPALSRNPTPWFPNPATASGAYNNATPTGLQKMLDSANPATKFDLNPVKSYITTDHNTGNLIVVNVTLPGHTLFPGFTARMISEVNGKVSMTTWGEGLGALQSDRDRAQFIRDGINDAWFDAQKTIIKDCGCS